MEESLDTQIKSNPVDLTINDIIEIHTSEYDPTKARLGGLMEGDGDCK